MNEPMLKRDAAPVDIGSAEFFQRARARLRFEIPPGLNDASIIPVAPVMNHTLLMSIFPLKSAPFLAFLASQLSTINFI